MTTSRSRPRPAGVGRLAVRMTALTALTAALALVAACAPAFRGPPPLEALVGTDAQVVLGERVFAAACHGCHPNALAGLGPGIIDSRRPNWLIRLQVRTGLGAMPAFSTAELDDVELDAVLAYLDALRER